MRSISVQRNGNTQWVFALLASVLLHGCGTNPVTGETELQFISTTQEIRMGEQAYFPTRQVQGGDYVVHPQVTDYVRRVNGRLTAVAHRDLPFEIVVLNSSVPNAWAMPGGKMAINRGLLVQLQSEAELAAVLGHEIVHSAARHSAQAQERGMLLQGGLMAAQIAGAGSDYRDLIAGGAMLGAQLISTRYGREAELESDRYGMEYMFAAGYNPAAAIDLQNTFVKLSQGRPSSWVDGLFASHPPSEERVARNRETAARLGGTNLEYGRERYRRAIAPLLQDQPAYDAHDAALKAAQGNDFQQANALIDKAIRLQPAEAKFYGLKGDLALAGKQYAQASRWYDKAIDRYPQYFVFHLQQGLAKKESGDAAGARRALERSNQLVPTPIAQKLLGDLAILAGDETTAVQYYQAASTSRSETGEAARVALARIELEENPAKYVKSQLMLDKQGRVVVVIQNQAPVAVQAVEVLVVPVDPAGRQSGAGQRYALRQTLAPGAQTRVVTSLPAQARLRAVVSRAQLVR